MPISFSDFGADCGDLFGDHHASDGVSYSHKGQMASGAGYELNLKNATGANEVEWDFKAALPNCDVTYDSSNTISKKISLAVKQVEGLTTTWDCSFNTGSGLNLGNVNLNFANDKVNANLKSTVNKSPELNFDAAVASSCGAVAGVSASFDAASGNLGDVGFGFHKAMGNVQLSFKADDAITAPLNGELSVYQALPGNKDFCCVGIQANTGTGALSFAAATTCCSKNTMRYKLEHTGMFHVAKVQKLNNCVALNLSACVNLKDMSAGGHKFGAGLKWE